MVRMYYVTKTFGEPFQHTVETIFNKITFCAFRFYFFSNAAVTFKLKFSVI